MAGRKPGEEADRCLVMTVNDEQRGVVILMEQLITDYSLLITDYSLFF